MASQISLKNVLAAVIKAIDMYNFLLKGHHKRTAIIAYQLGNAYGLEGEELSDLVLAASLHDIGALHVTDRDRLIEIDVEDPEPHEVNGANMLAGFEPFAEIARIIRHHHIRYEDVLSGKVPKEEVPRACYFLHLADRVDILLMRHEGQPDQRQLTVDAVDARFGTAFCPQLAACFHQIAAADDFWENIAQSAFHELLFFSLGQTTLEIDNEDIERLAVVFARIVDYKSPWTSRHSQAVGALACRIGQLLDLSPDECFELKIAGYMHDIGKIAISSEVLNKPGRLNEEEYKEIKSHAVYSSVILSSIEGFSNITRWAINHHERRDGSGYPLRLNEHTFSEKMDIVAYADLFSALAEDRPYRSSMNQREISAILQKTAPLQLSERICNVIQDHLDELYYLQKAI